MQAHHNNTKLLPKPHTDQLTQNQPCQRTLPSLLQSKSFYYFYLHVSFRLPGLSYRPSISLVVYPFTALSTPKVACQPQLPTSTNITTSQTLNPKANKRPKNPDCNDQESLGLRNSSRVYANEPVALPVF